MESLAFDDLDRRLVHALQVDGRASFGRIAEVLTVSDRTLARRYRRLRAAGVLRVVGVPTAHALGQEDWLVRFRCSPDAAAGIAQVLAARSDTSWVAIASGGAEITCLTRVAGTVVLQAMPRSPRIVEVTAQRLLQTVAGADGWPRRRAALTADEVTALGPPLPSPRPAGPPAALTPADHRMLAALARDGRTGYAALAAGTGWSATTVARRLTELRRSGALTFTVDVEPGLYGAGKESMMWLTVAPSALDMAGAALSRHPDVAFAAVTTGATNLIAYVAHADDDHLHRQILLPIGRIPGVEHIDLAPVAVRVTRSAPVPRGARGPSMWSP